ncbi:MAG: hypothetical protein HQ564_08065 [Candidatus Saganbacteria bacterium]|nr:hypothetical protein [Candidatus Saganbacteria bacterium]
MKILIGSGNSGISKYTYIRRFGSRMPALRAKISDLIRNGIAVSLGRTAIARSTGLRLEDFYKKGIAFELLEISIKTAWQRFGKVEQIKLLAISSANLKMKGIGQEIVRSLNQKSIDRRFDYLVEIGFIKPKDTPDIKDICGTPMPEFEEDSHPVYMRMRQLPFLFE